MSNHHGYFAASPRTVVDPLNPPASPGRELQRALYEALTDDAYLMTLIAGVYDFVPEKDPFGSVQGYVSFGPLDVVNDNSECIEAGLYTWQLDVWSRQRNSMHCRDVVDQIRRILDGSNFDLPDNAAAGTTIEAWRFMRDPDGLTTHGIVSVQLTIEDQM
jgi:hypothetical protein